MGQKGTKSKDGENSSVDSFPADTTVTAELLENSNFRLTIGIKNSIPIGDYTNISPFVTISADIGDDSDLMEEANRLYNKISPVYGFLLLSEYNRAKVAQKNVISLAKQLLEFNGRGGNDE